MILVTGASGQLGTELKSLLDDQAVYTDHPELDITDEAAVGLFFKSNKIDLIINCAAYTAVDKAEDDKELCFAVNVKGPLNLSKLDVPIIHISTDYVFSGEAHIPYTEVDQTSPKSAYGESKRDGEIAIIENASCYSIIRTSWLYSDHHPSFYQTMVRLGGERKSLNVVSDQVGTPTKASDLAKAIVALIPKVKEGMKDIFHFSNEGVCSWYDFAHAIMELNNLDCEVSPIGSDQYPTKAARPHYSVLNKAKIKNELGITISHWRDALKEMIQND